MEGFDREEQLVGRGNFSIQTKLKLFRCEFGRSDQSDQLEKSMRRLIIFLRTINSSTAWSASSRVCCSSRIDLQSRQSYEDTVRSISLLNLLCCTPQFDLQVCQQYERGSAHYTAPLGAFCSANPFVCCSSQNC